MLCGAEVALCSEINTKNTNMVWVERTVVSRNQQALKG
jgi:hypothetical protein